MCGYSLAGTQRGLADWARSLTYLKYTRAVSHCARAYA